MEWTIEHGIEQMKRTMGGEAFNYLNLILPNCYSLENVKHGLFRRYAL